MGTSASSSGPGGGVSFDPPWLDEIESPQTNVTGHDDQGNDGVEGTDQSDNQPKPEVAPPRRFQSARRLLTDYVRTGDRDSFQKAMGHYSRTGMGGAGNVATRMRTSTRSAVSLYGFFQTVREGTDTAINEWVTALTSRNASADEVINQIINKVAPIGGSLDETSCKESMAQAMGNLLEKDPNLNLFNLDYDNIWTLMESFLGYEAFKRLCLDIGKVFESSIISPRDRVLHMKEMQKYLKAEISVQTEKLRKNEKRIALNQLQTILQSAIKNTFIVYEGSL
jgi:hypothetical protein